MLYQLSYSRPPGDPPATGHVLRCQVPGAAGTPDTARFRPLPSASGRFRPGPRTRRPAPPFRTNRATLLGRRAGGEGRIRTSEGKSQQIYSLPRLTASVPLHMPTRVGNAAQTHESVGSPAPARSAPVEGGAAGPVASLRCRLASALLRARGTAPGCPVLRLDLRPGLRLGPRQPTGPAPAAPVALPTRNPDARRPELRTIRFAVPHARRPAPGPRRRSAGQPSSRPDPPGAPASREAPRPPPGAGEGTRTLNLLITNQPLYPLSYASREARL